MTSREKFEAWMTAEQWFHGSDFEWDERRNCYAQFGIHLAYKAFMAAEGAAEQNLTDMAVQLANAESKCRELAAENAGLKNPDNWLSQSDYGYEASEVATQNGATEDESLRAGMIAIINRIGTPATDAFLAEVRAQGVERMIEVKQQQLDGMHPDTFAIGAVRDSIRRDIYELKVFAEILRQEAAQ
ncbi:hypothetical protein BFQ28_15245 [Citrobacter freundii]|uniref:hypothetical protein n=1 Tax=Citrobacter freundii TaxID=546 RepID=UPI000841D5BE|nr:hypothetical protein [Citrobacter freundii]AOI31113.1 hypothetical protein BFQ28_15245 [Citrobacter freundii]